MLSYGEGMSYNALVCRSTIAAKAQYREIAARMPLIEPYRATLEQMTDTSLADREDVVMLGAWLGEIRECRQQLADAAIRELPTSLAGLLAAWNKDDEVFVLLARRKLAWGEAVTRLRSNEAELLAAQTTQAVQLAAQVSSAKQAELSRRVSVLNALTNLAR